MSSQLWYSRKQVAERLGVSEDTAARRFPVGSPGVMKDGRIIRVSKERIEAYERQHAHGKHAVRRAPRHLPFTPAPAGFLAGKF
jgi:hypothetical protein